MQASMLRLYRRRLRNMVAPENRLTAAFVLFGLMVAVGAIPGEAQALSAAFGDKALHFCFYSLLSLLIYSGGRGSAAQCAMSALLWTALLGAADEIIQGLMPYRSIDVLDWAWDLMAACWTVATLLALDMAGFRFRRGAS